MSGKARGQFSIRKLSKALLDILEENSPLECIRLEGLTYVAEGGDSKMKRPHPALTIQNEAERKMRSFMEAFGMSAGSRSRIKVDRPANTENPVEKFMEGR